MMYAKSFEIEHRLEALLSLIQEGTHSTPALAQALSVSIPTVSRCIQALRARGHTIRATRRGDSWAFVLDQEANIASGNSHGHTHARTT
jgi:biotin operon repressor